MYLTSFVHREDLFNIAERWLCAEYHPSDALRLTEIFICDGFIIGETLNSVAHLLLDTIFDEPFRQQRIHFKGELRDVISSCSRGLTPRVEELFRLYHENPDFYYREVPVNGVMCLDASGHLLGVYRVKRPRRIAEKANRRIANWIFRTVQDRAQKMAGERASKYGIPLDMLITPESEMVKEFVEAETEIARSFSDETIKFDRAAMTIHDVGGMKIIADSDKLRYLETILEGDHPSIAVVDKHNFPGPYQAVSLLLDVTWDAEHVCRRYFETESWKKFLNRGISEEKLKRGLEPLLVGAHPKIEIELILSTFPDMVESELGNSIHEGMIVSQRGSRSYKGYIPMNVEFILEYLFAVGFSPKSTIDCLPVKLWGRYLPDTIISHIRRLYDLPQSDLLY